MKLGSEEVDLLRTMILIRRFEEKLEEVFSSGIVPGFIHLSVGQEAVAVGAIAAIGPDDHMLVTHRPHHYCLARGVEPGKLMAEILGKRTGVNGGKSGHMHISDFSRGMMGGYAIVGENIPVADGVALASKLRKQGRVTVCFFGDGATNTGAFHEGLNLAAIWNLPVVFVCDNNRWAVSTPIERAVKISNLAERAAGYGMPGVPVDGNDVLEVRQAVEKAVELARGGNGPTLIEAKTYRLRGHYIGDPEHARTREEVAKWEANCPIKRYRERLLSENLITSANIEDIEYKVRDEIKTALDFAAKSPNPDPAEAIKNAYTEEPSLVGKPFSQVVQEPSENMSYRGAINNALKEEMRRDPSIFLIGEDIGKNGGVFGATLGLYNEFGPDRLRDTPISEAAIIGCAAGAALAGMRPVAEIQFFDFVFIAMDQIVNVVAKMSYLYGQYGRLPLTIRLPVGGVGLAVGPTHGQSLYSMFAHVPGLQIAAPAAPGDAKGLLKTALRGNGPVIFLEGMTLYKEREPVPRSDYATPFGVATVKRVGNDVTIVAFLGMVTEALKAAERLAEIGISAEVVDPRTIHPLDRKAIVQSVKKTGRLVVADSSPVRCGIQSEIASVVLEAAFDYLDAPIKRVGGLDSPVSFNPVFERAILPSAAHIVDAAREVAGK